MGFTAPKASMDTETMSVQDSITWTIDMQIVFENMWKNPKNVFSLPNSSPILWLPNKFREVFIFLWNIFAWIDNFPEPNTLLCKKNVVFTIIRLIYLYASLCVLYTYEASIEMHVFHNQIFVRIKSALDDFP